jgi:hypothetical protein
MTQSATDDLEKGTEDTMSKLVGALLLELAEDVPDKASLESVRADLVAASKVYESGKKKDLALRFYLATRSLLHEIERLEKEAAKHKELPLPFDAGQQMPQQPQQTWTNENYAPQQQDGNYQN